MKQAARLALGTLTVVPVRPPGTIDRQVASRAMALAPLVGALLAVPAMGLLAVVAAVASDRPVAPAPLAAVLTLGLLALLTRGLHLDGLADTADGLGSGRGPERALEVMRRGDVGPFGVVALVLVLMTQAAAITELVSRGQGITGVAAALVCSRAVLPVVCWERFPPARPDGLGRLVAGSVSTRLLLAPLVGSTAVVALLVLAGTWLDGPVSGGPVGTDGVPWTLLAALPVGLAAGTALGAHCIRRLGGVTGDVLGGCVETAFTAALVVLALA